MMTDSVAPYLIVNPGAHGRFLFTAEHASNHIPSVHSEVETSLLHTHWAWDIGIDLLMKQLCGPLKSCGIQSQFSRLWIDANRAPDQEGLIKESIEGVSLSFNQRVSQEEKHRRLTDFHAAYHEAITRMILSHAQPPLFVSLHSFTPIWSGRLRSMDIGVLFDRDEEVARALAEILKDDGFFVALNEPYSGKNGLIYAAHRHGMAHKIPYVELEFNQSILSSPERIVSVASRLIDALNRLHKEHKMLLQEKPLED